MGVVLLTTILWLTGGIDKTISVRAVASMAECRRLAEQFDIGVEIINAQNPPPLAWGHTSGCRLWLPRGGVST